MPLTCEIPFHLHHFTQSDYIVHQGASVHPQFIVAIAVSLCRTNLFSNSRTKNIIFIILNCNNRNEHLWIISRSWKQFLNFPFMVSFLNFPIVENMNLSLNLNKIVAHKEGAKEIAFLEWGCRPSKSRKLCKDHPALTKLLLKMSASCCFPDCIFRWTLQKKVTRRIDIKGGKVQ